MAVNTMPPYTLLKQQRLVITSSLVTLLILSTPSAADVDLFDLDLAELLAITIMEVDTRTDNGYLPRQVISGSRIAVDPLTLPMSITVLTREVIDDLGIENIEQAANYIGSVNKSGGERDGEKRSIRGQSENDAIPSLRNGMKMMHYSDTVNMSRIEVIKGATSVIYGQTGPGGAVNYITKKPSFTADQSVSIAVGNYDKQRVEIESTGPITLFGDETLAYRFAASSTESDSDEKAEHLDKKYYDFALAWRINDSITWSAEYEELSRDWNPSQGPVLQANNDGTLSYDRSSLGVGREDAYWRGPNDYFQNDSEILLTTLDWQITKALTYRFNFMKGEYERQVHARNPAFIFDAATPLTASDLDIANGQPSSHIGRYPIQVRRTIEKNETWQIRQDLNYTFNLAETEHSVALAYDHFKLRSGENPSDNAKNWQLAPPWDPNNPTNNAWDESGSFNDSNLVNGWPKLPESAYGDLSLNTNSTGHDAFSLSGFSKFYNNRLTVMWGGRHDKITNPNVSKDTWQLGAIYQLNMHWHPFINHGTTFKSNGIGRSGETLTPESGESTEAGVKFQFLNNDIAGSLSYFISERENTLKLSDVIIDGVKVGEINTADGVEESEGIELDVTINAVNNWQLLFSASYMDHEVTESDSNPIEVGQTLRYGADKMASVFAKYHFTQNLSGLAVGLGANYRSDIRVGNAIQQHRVDSRTLLDGLIQYKPSTEANNIEISLNLYNITDKDYIDRGQGWGEPFSAVLACRITF